MGGNFRILRELGDVETIFKIDNKVSTHVKYGNIDNDYNPGILERLCYKGKPKTVFGFAVFSDPKDELGKLELEIMWEENEKKYKQTLVLKE